MKKSKNWVLFGFIFCLFFSYFIYEKWPDSYVQIIFCDIGQGDSILIQQGFFQVLIDSGPDDRVLGCLGKFIPPWDRIIELIILTHGDADHIGYFSEILSLYQAKYIFFPDTPKNTATVKGLKEAIDQELQDGAFLKRPILGQSVSLPSGGTLTFLERPGKLPPGASENDRSIVCLLEYGQTRWLFTGDLEEKGEISLLKHGLLPQVDGLKVGHHGSASSSSLDFLKKLQPQLAAISVGAKNTYGHPTAKALGNLQTVGSVVLRTDQLGDIETATDGQRIWIQSTSHRP